MVTARATPGRMRRISVAGIERVSREKPQFVALLTNPVLVPYC